MTAVKHYFVVCVPRQNRAEAPVSAEDKGAFWFLTNKTYLRKYFKVFCVGYTDLDHILHLARMSFRNGVFIKDVPRSVLSDLDITPLTYADFLDYCHASMLRDCLDSGEVDYSHQELTPIYYVPSILNYDPERYQEALMTKLCDCFSFDDFFNYESACFGMPNGVYIVNPREAAEEYGITVDCFGDKEFKLTSELSEGNPVANFFRLQNVYISDAKNKSLFSREDTVVVHEDDLPDDDELNSCFAQYKECVL